MQIVPGTCRKLESYPHNSCLNSIERTEKLMAKYILQPHDMVKMKPKKIYSIAEEMGILDGVQKVRIVT